MYSQSYLFLKLLETSTHIFINHKFDNTVYTKDFINKLLHNMKEEGYYLNVSNQSSPIFSGFPFGNLLKIICRLFELWIRKEKFPVRFQLVDGINVNDISNERLIYYSHILHDKVMLLSRIIDVDADLFYSSLIFIYETLQIEGFLLLLGFRLTNKSFFLFPPNRNKLVHEFNRQYNDSSNITIGARAVSKHSDRNKNNINIYWGKVKGTEDERNVYSNKICLDILAKCMWVNMFCLSDNCKLLEVRNSLGYGLRWEFHEERIFFKGLVEPTLNTHNNKKFLLKVSENETE